MAIGIAEHSPQPNSVWITSCNFPRVKMPGTCTRLQIGGRVPCSETCNWYVRPVCAAGFAPFFMQPTLYPDRRRLNAVDIEPFAPGRVRSAGPRPPGTTKSSSRSAPKHCAALAAVNLRSGDLRQLLSASRSDCLKATRWFYEGECQGKKFSTERKPRENSRHSAPDSVGTRIRVRLVPFVQSRAHRRPSGDAKDPGGFYFLAFPLSGTRFSERPGAVKAAPLLRGEAEP